MSETITIKRSPHDKENPFVQINRQLLRLPDSILSLEARGALCYFLSFCDGWVFHPEKVKKDLKISDKRYRRIVNELRETGYFLRSYYLVKNMKRYEYFFSEFPQEEWMKIYKEQEDSNNFTDTSTTEASNSDGSRLGSTKNNEYKEKISKEEELMSSCSSSTPLSDIRRHSSSMHSDARKRASESVPAEKSSSSRKPFRLKNCKEKEEFLSSTGINMREDTLGFLCSKYRLEELKDAFVKFKKIKNPRVPIAVYRSLLNGNMPNIPGTEGESNYEFVCRFIKENEITHLEIMDTYVKNLETGNEISFQISREVFNLEIIKWMYR